MTHEPHHNHNSAYEIRIKDHLDEHWLAFFPGWQIQNFENGEVLISTPNIDQAGLHGVLNRIRDLNLTLLSVKQIGRKINGDPYA